MRGSDVRTGELFSYVDLEERVPGNHPLRVIRRIVNEVLAALDGEFEKLYAARRATFDCARAAAAGAFVAGVLHHPLGAAVDGAIALQSALSLVRRSRGGRSGVGADGVHEEPGPAAGGRCGAQVSGRTSRPQGGAGIAFGRTLLGRRHAGCGVGFDEELRGEGRFDEPPSAGRNGERDFHHETRSNATHTSSTDPESKLYKKGKGKEAKLSFIGNVMTENRNGFVVAADLREASDTAEHAAASTMIVRYSPGNKRITVGADKGFDTADFVADMRDFNVSPHVAQNITRRRSAIDGRTTRHRGYEISQQKRKRVEEPFGWGKTIGGLARPMLRGVQRLGFELH